jgi:hypothetical protein
MSLSSISGDSAAMSALQQRRNALKQLDTDAEAGNFAAAQSDLAAFQQLSQSQGATAPASSSGASSSTISSLQSDLTNLLGAALGGASSSSSSLKSSATAVENDLSAFSGFTSSSTNPMAAALNDLLAAAQTGDAAQAKRAAQTLIGDLQGSQGGAGAHHGCHHNGGGGSDDLTATADQLIDPSASPAQSAFGLPQALLDALDTNIGASNPNASNGATASRG